MINVTKSQETDLSYYLPDNTTTRKIADFFAIFADQSRVRLLSALAITRLCVTDIATTLRMNQTTVSHQLKTLRDAGLVRYLREGKILYYELTSSKINDILLVGVEYLGY
ncbi:MAG: metalloregulator ArsR/SmtB family transcription factor [Clostridia bacterium]